MKITSLSLLCAVLSLAALPSCSSPSHQVANTSTPGSLLPPRLSTDGSFASLDIAGSRVVVVNPNERISVKVDYVRMTPSQSLSATSQAVVPPGGSVVIGPSSTNGNHHDYQLTGWTKTRSVERVAQARVKKQPMIAATEPNSD